MASYLVKHISCTCLGDCHTAITYLYTLGGNITLVKYLMFQFVFYILRTLFPIPYLHILEIVELDLVEIELDHIDQSLFTG